MNTKQQEFDAVVNHLYAQGRPALNGTACAYRSADGLMCAVGCRIPDESYTPVFEGRLVYGLLQKSADLGISIPPEIEEYYKMFDILQDIHDAWDYDNDGVYQFSYISRRLMELAGQEGVTFNDPRGPA